MTEEVVDTLIVYQTDAKDTCVSCKEKDATIQRLEQSLSIIMFSLEESMRREQDYCRLLKIRKAMNTKIGDM